jgi:hypothetical protein
MSNAKLNHILDTLQTVVALVGRIAYDPRELREIITKGRHNPENYITGYNSCNGKKTIRELSEIFDADRGNLSRTLKDWAALGIVYEITKPKGRFYKKIYPLEGE